MEFCLRLCRNLNSACSFGRHTFTNATTHEKSHNFTAFTMSGVTCSNILRVGNSIPHLHRLSLYVPHVIPLNLCRQWMHQSELRGYKEACVSLQQGSRVVHSVDQNHVHNKIKSSAFAQHLLFLCWNHIPKHLSLQIEPAVEVHEPQKSIIRQQTWQLEGIHPQIHFTKFADIQAHNDYDPSSCADKLITGDSTDNQHHRIRCFLTLQIYLNDDYAGGADCLTKYALQSQPISTGDMLLFDPKIIHRSSPVVLGSKYMLHSHIMYRRARADSDGPR